MEVPLPKGQSPTYQMMYAVHYASAYLRVPSENIAVDLKGARLVIHDRAHDDPEAKVVRVLRASRTNRGLWFDTDETGKAHRVISIPGSVE